MAKFDKDAFMKTLNAPLIDRLPRLIPPGQSGFFVYEGKRPMRALAQGIASAFPGRVRIVELVSDLLMPGDSGKLLEPLLRGQTLVFVHTGESQIPGRLAAYWPRYVRNPQGYLAAITQTFVLHSGLKLERAGALVVVQATSRREAFTREVDVWPLLEKEAEKLEKAGSQVDTPISFIGMQRTDPNGLITMTDLSSDLIGRTQYELAYRRYRRLVNHLLTFTSKQFAAISLADTALRSRDEKQVLLQAQYHNLLSALESVWDSVQVIRSITLELSGGRHHDDPLPDVYAAALSMRISGDWRCDRERSLYRGQRNSTWRVIPTLYRPGANGAAPDVDACLERVGAFSHALKSIYDSFSDDQCMAIAQHFGKEAKTRTPLIDVTWDPLVALFFASDGAEANDLGVVDHLVIPEWQKLVATSPHEPGFIKVIEVSEIQRIVRQRALFLAAPDPEAYARFVPYCIWFKQHEGLVFEDEEYEQPISGKSLYPIDTSMQVILDRFAKEPFPANATAISVTKTNKVFGTDYLLERAREMVPSLSGWDSFNITVLKTCAEFFARGHEWSDDLTMYSLHRWQECLNIIDTSARAEQRCLVKDALRFTLSRIDNRKEYEIVAFAQRIWQHLHGTTPSTVVDRLGELLELTRGSRMIAAVCFAGSESHVGAVLAELANDQRWTLIDLRNVGEEEIIPAIKRVEQPTVMVIATDKTTEFLTPVRLLFKTARDGRQELIFGRQTLMLHPETRPYLVTWGRSFEYENEARHLMDAWDEVDEFEG